MVCMAHKMEFCVKSPLQVAEKQLVKQIWWEGEYLQMKTKEALKESLMSISLSPMYGVRLCGYLYYFQPAWRPPFQRLGPQKYICLVPESTTRKPNPSQCAMMHLTAIDNCPQPLQATEISTYQSKP